MKTSSLSSTLNIWFLTLILTIALSSCFQKNIQPINSGKKVSKKQLVIKVNKSNIRSSEKAEETPTSQNHENRKVESDTLSSVILITKENNNRKKNNDEIIIDSSEYIKILVDDEIVIDSTEISKI